MHKTLSILVALAAFTLLSLTLTWIVAANPTRGQVLRGRIHWLYNESGAAVGRFENTGTQPLINLQMTTKTPEVARRRGFVTGEVAATTFAAWSHDGSHNAIRRNLRRGIKPEVAPFHLEAPMTQATLEVGDSWGFVFVNVSSVFPLEITATDAQGHTVTVDQLLPAEVPSGLTPTPTAGGDHPHRR